MCHFIPNHDLCFLRVRHDLCFNVINNLYSYIIYRKSFIQRLHERNYVLGLKVKIQKIPTPNTMILTLKQGMQQTTINKSLNAYSLTKTFDL